MVTPSGVLKLHFAWPVSQGAVQSDVQRAHSALWLTAGSASRVSVLTTSVGSPPSPSVAPSHHLSPEQLWTSFSKTSPNGCHTGASNSPYRKLDFCSTLSVLQCAPQLGEWDPAILPFPLLDTSLSLSSACPFLLRQSADPLLLSFKSILCESLS